LSEQLIRIERTWDDKPTDPSQWATVRLTPRPGFLLISVEAPFYGDPPPEGPLGSTWKLWQHEVVEIFLVGEHENYVEIELGPHGHHLVLMLEGRRRIVEQHLPIDYSAEIIGDQWSGVAELAIDQLPERCYRVNAYAVHGVEERTYLAAYPVPGDNPDFHRLENFGPIDLGDS
jgi:hypothetical protein